MMIINQNENSVTVTVTVSTHVARYLELLDVRSHQTGRPKAENVLRRLAEIAADEVRQGGPKKSTCWLAKTFSFALVEDEIFRQVALGHLRVCPDGQFHWVDDNHWVDDEARGQRAHA